MRGARRAVINHASLYDKVAVQQQVLCPLRGCESSERVRSGGRHSGRQKGSLFINPTDINETTLIRQSGRQAGDGRRGLQGI